MSDASTMHVPSGCIEQCPYGFIHDDELWRWSFGERFLEDIRQASLSLGDLARVVLPDRDLVVAEQVSNVDDRHQDGR
jgi:hypothetical protein